jgi:hypothetical protein
VDYEPGPLKIAFNGHARLIAATVVRAAGLDDKVATVSDMDTKAKDMRFGCSVCPPLKRNATSWVKGGHKWREFVRSCLLPHFSPTGMGFLLGFTLYRRLA